MAKALKSPDGDVLYRNPANALTVRRRASGALEGVHDGWDVSPTSASYVVNPVTGLVFAPCRAVIPASWLIELEGPVAYLRRLAAHRRRVRAGQRRAVEERQLAPPTRDPRLDRLAYNDRVARTYVSPTEIVARGSEAQGVPHVLYRDVVTVRCRRCDAWLLGAGMGRVRDAVFGPDSRRGRRLCVLRRVLPATVAVTVSVGESYCPTCAPKAKASVTA